MPIDCQSTSRTKGGLRREVLVGFSLLEVIAGLAVIALILVPTTSLMQDVLQGEAVQRNRGELMHLALGKQNEFCHALRVQFRESRQSGDFSRQGYPELKYQVNCSEDSASGGIPNRLMAVQTIAWHDRNGNRSPDTDETTVDLWTSVARATP